MSAADYRPKAFLGGALTGHRPVRFVYIDEAGTSAGEPVTVVNGIIVNADSHWLAAEQELNRVLEKVPSRFRDGFVFHAKTIWGSKQYREGWSREDRFDLIKEVASIPKRLNLPISIGKVRRDAPHPSDMDLPMSKSQFQHFIAFMHCLIMSDAFLREHCPPDEIATVIAEDVDEMRRFLKMAIPIAKSVYVPEVDAELRPTMLEMITGNVTQRPRWGIERIKDGVQFASKDAAPLLQIADACAFSFRRFFADQSGGDELVRAILGYRLFPYDWAGPCSYAIFRANKNDGLSTAL